MDTPRIPETAEHRRLRETNSRTAHWRRWGPFLAERAWGTVREDYSLDGTAWEYFPHDHARSRAYRWNEDGLGGICDRHQYICFALALWNGRDPILKERLFGLTGNQGNHGEDVKESYFYVDSTPTHSYMKFLYKYPQREFPYAQLLEENNKRDRTQPEYELLDTGIFDENRYFDVFIEYAKADPDDVLIEITAHNRGPEPAELHLLPTLWFRNEWSWTPRSARHDMHLSTRVGRGRIEIKHPYYRQRHLYWQPKTEDILFTENDTNYQRLWGAKNPSPYVKDAFHDRVIHGNPQCVNPERKGTKAALWHKFTIAPGKSERVRLRLTKILYSTSEDPFGAEFDHIFTLRKKEADEFYATVIPESMSPDARNVMRQSFAGLLWSKQFYHFEVDRWLAGDPGQPKPPEPRVRGRNRTWKHLYNADVISMPDKWEYPWYAAWDLAFHTIPLALVDPDFAKEQLVLMLREWYMHPNGQIPAYEWEFGDVNPPVHAWAALRVYQIEKKRKGVGDFAFLERVFHKLMLNFTWWVNRKDAEGNNIFEGGFLGLDNIGVFDRNKPLPTGGFIEQSDGTSWMAMYSLNLMAMALELARTNPAYEDVASKFWEHFIHIAYAMSNRGSEHANLWDEEDGFFYDVLHLPNDTHQRLKIRSMVGLIPLFAVEILDSELLNKLPGFKKRMEWFIENRPELTETVASMLPRTECERRIMSVVSPARLKRVLAYMLDEKEFLSPYGIRALSRKHKDEPYVVHVDGVEHKVEYEPGMSKNALFGGNSNWRGPVWFPVNYLLIESLQRFAYAMGPRFQVECPTGSGKMMPLDQVGEEISHRLAKIFMRRGDGTRPVNGGSTLLNHDPHWRDLVLFYEFFHGEDASGLGASHQTGWTGLVAKLMQQAGDPYRTESKAQTATTLRR